MSTTTTARWRLRSNFLRRALGLLLRGSAGSSCCDVSVAHSQSEYVDVTSRLQPERLSLGGIDLAIDLHCLPNRPDLNLLPRLGIVKRSKSGVSSRPNSSWVPSWWRSWEPNSGRQGCPTRKKGGEQAMIEQKGFVCRSALLLRCGMLKPGCLGEPGWDYLRWRIHD